MAATACRGRRSTGCAFAQRELWPDYRGAGADSAVVDILEHWLEPAEEAGP